MSDTLHRSLSKWLQITGDVITITDSIPRFDTVYCILDSRKLQYGVYPHYIKPQGVSEEMTVCYPRIVDTLHKVGGKK